MTPRWPWRPSRRFGRSRGIAVFGPSGFDDPGRLRELFHAHERLTDWLADRGLQVGHDRTGLDTVDGALDDWRDDPQIGPMLVNEVATFLGCVLVTVLPDARWAVWPNGHPIVDVGGTQLDTIDIVARRVDSGEPPLRDVLGRAAGST